MKHITLISLLSFVVIGCAAVAPISYQEDCALKGLVLSGVNTGSGSAIAIGNNGRYATARGYSESVACEVPRTPAQTCEVRRLSSVAYPKTSYNHSIQKWNLGIGAGYLLWVIPGVGVKLWADSKYDTAMADSERTYHETVGLCSLEAPPQDVRTPSGQ